MHRLKEITVKNYRSIKSENFTLSGYTALIGYNNAGKTNLLTACSWLLSKSSLTESDFNDPKQHVEIEGVISGISTELLDGITPNHRESIRPYLENENLVIRRVQEKPRDGVAAIRLFVKKVTVTEGENPWTLNPAGIDNAIKAIFPEPIIIGAIENIEEDVTKNKSTTTIGRLISEIIAPIEERYGGQAKDAMEVLRKALDADGEDRAPELQTFDEQANEKLQVLFPGVSIRLHVPTPELKEFFKSGTIKVYEEGHTGGRDISSLGSGTQRSVQMALIRQLAEVKKGISPTPSCTLLLIDEPELYLHPQAIEQVRVALKQLSREGYQVIFATHSAQMIKAEDVNKAILIRKEFGRGTYRRKRIEDAISEILEGEEYASQLEMMFALSHSNQILFAESVLLTEGKTEHYVLPEVFERMTEGETFGTIKCALVRQGGVDNTHKSMDILRAMDIPTKAIVDLDYAFGQAIKCGLIEKNNADVKVCLDIFATMEISGDVILENGLPTKSGKLNKVQAYQKMLTDTNAQKSIEKLHNVLKEKGIWLWKKGDIEIHLGITGKKHKFWSGFVERVKHEGCEKAIPDFEEVQRLVQWIKEG